MALTYTEPARQIPVYGEYDVVVAGGGPAGFAAAVSAARAGAKTLLIERFASLGGTVTASLMAKINGFRNQVEPNTLQTSRGIAEEVMLKLYMENGVGERYLSENRVYYHDPAPGKMAFGYVIDPEKFKYVTLSIAAGAGVELLFHTFLADAIVEDGQVRGVLIENKSGRQAVFAHTVIDATGDGDVAFRAGAAYFHGEEGHRMSDTLLYRVAGVRGKSERGCQMADSVLLWGPQPGDREYDGRSEMEQYLEGSPEKLDREYDATDARALSRAELETRLNIYRHFKAQKEKEESFSEAYVVQTPDMIGIRQTRFIQGKYTLTGEDVLEGRRFDDTVAMASKPVVHYYGYRRFLKHTGYEIPFRCLVPETLEGLLTAGRCMSALQPAFESSRSIAPSMCLGEAAGAAAALAAQAKIPVSQVNIRTLQKLLIEKGAEIGQSNRNVLTGEGLNVQQ